IDDEMATTAGKSYTAEKQREALEKVKKEELVILAPRDGVVGQCPRVDDIGKMFEGSREQPQAQPLFTLHAGQVRVCLPLETADYTGFVENRKENEREERAAGGGRQRDAARRGKGGGFDRGRGGIARRDQWGGGYVPVALSSGGGGRVPVPPPSQKSPGLVP